MSMRFTALRGANRSTKKGGAPEDARRSMSMENIAERPAKGTLISSPSPKKQAADWLNAQIVASQSRITMQTVDLTPALAQVLLDRNPDNRKVSSVVVENYARDMANGAWVFNGEPIIIAKNGEMNDGQHRCHAVIIAGVAIPVIMVFGTDRTSRLTIDQGKVRMAGDYLSMNGHTDGVALAAAAKYIWQHRNHGRLSNQTFFSPTKSEILDLIDTTPTIADSLAAIQSKGSDAVGGRSILAFLHWTFTRMCGTRTDADVFIGSLINGMNLTARSPILYARNRLMAERGRIKPNEKAELIIRAWNAHRRGDKVASLPIKGGALPTVER